MPTIVYTNASHEQASDGAWTITVEYGLKVRPWESGRWVNEQVAVAFEGQEPLACASTNPPTQLPTTITTEASDSISNYAVLARSMQLKSEADPTGASVTVDVREAPLEKDIGKASL